MPWPKGHFVFRGGWVAASFLPIQFGHIRYYLLSSAFGHLSKIPEFVFA
jgi:hypothetical protein